MAMFAGGLCAGMERGHYVTLDLTTHFLARGRPGSPLDAHVELVKQTRGHAFLQGVVRQDGEPCYSFSGTLKRIRERQRTSMTGPVRAAYDQLVAAGRAEARPGAGARGRGARPAGGEARRPAASSTAVRAEAATRRPASICGAGSAAANRC